jgi:hypothetical protein
MNDVPSDTMERLPNVSELLKQAAADEAKPAAQAENESCGNCYFMRSALEGGKITHSCREDSPRTFQVASRTGQMGFIGVYPPTILTNWCGKWEPKAKKAG